MTLRSIRPAELARQRAVDSRRHDLERIQAALEAAGSLLPAFLFGSAVTVEFKGQGHPVTVADRAANQLLWEMLPEHGEGWLSEEERR